MISYKAHFPVGNVVVIGAGGTGGRLIPGLVQLVRQSITRYNPQALRDNIPFYVIDDDVVEEKNLARQHFIQEDVGRPKAAVMAERYSAAFGIEVTPLCTRVSKHTSQMNTATGSVPFATILQNSIVVLAVDSASARRDILCAMFSRMEHDRCIIIDAGNEDAFGQVRVFNPVRFVGSAPILPERCPVDYSIPRLPYDTHHYQNLGSSAQELSCEALPQTLAVNQMMATMILCICQNLLMRKPFEYLAVYMTMSGGCTTELTNLGNLTSRISKTDNTRRQRDLEPHISMTTGEVFDPILALAKTNLAKQGFILDLENGKITPSKKPPLKTEELVPVAAVAPKTPAVPKPVLRD